MSTAAATSHIVFQTAYNHSARSSFSITTFVPFIFAMTAFSNGL
jgi:hypothetical protein